MPKYLAQIEKVSAADVARVVKDLLKPEARVVVITEAQAEAKDGGAK